jgi:peptidyl-prolyl cis-trans isomerase D
MLEAIRRHAQGWMAKVILVLITIPFALWGVDSYMQGGSGTDVVAEVGDVQISRQEFARALQEQADRMRQAQGPNFEPSVTDTPEFRQQVLKRMVEREALLLDARQQGFRTPDTYVETVLLQVPAFQENGAFSRQRYEALLRQRGMSPVGFENELRQEFLIEVEISPASLGAFSARTSLAQISRLVSQQREISWVDMNPADVSGEVKVTPVDVQNYYTSHKAKFTVPERIRAEYLMLTFDSVAQGMVVGNEEIKQYYQANSGKFGQPEQRSASHILIAVARDADAAVRAQARSKATQLAEALRKAPASFGEVARKESQDPGSAAQNGSLGSFGRGAMVKPFEDAVFSMKTGEMRGPVESDFGFHIIRLDGIQAATVAPMESVRAEVEAELRKQQAQKKFAEVAESFSNLVYERADSLKPAADAMKLTVQSTNWMSSGSAPAPFNHSGLAKVLFSVDSIKNKQNTEAIEIAPGVLVAARVIEHRPAAVRALSEVSSGIQEKLRSERVVQLMAQKGEALIKQLKQGNEPGLRWSSFQTVSRQQPAGLDQKNLASTFQADVSKLPAYTGVAKPDGVYRIVRISRVLDGQVNDPGLLSSIEGGVQQAIQRADLAAMIALAKAGQKVEIRPNAIEQK